MHSAANILDRIVAQKEREIAQLEPREVTGPSLQEAVAARGSCRDFRGALERPRNGRIGLIAEVKKASPSAGVIRPDFDPVGIAREYEKAGADCLSVLTDPVFFQGSLANLRAIRSAVSLPLLRKDFLIDERQILEAIEWGADAVLLIAAILDDARLRRFHELATGAGLAALVEVHDAHELDRAVSAGASLIGINNRDLRHFTVDLQTTESLAQCLRQTRSRKETLLISESGINSRADVDRLAKAGAGAILVGESLMRHPDIQAKVRELMG